MIADGAPVVTPILGGGSCRAFPRGRTDPPSRSGAAKAVRRSGEPSTGRSRLSMGENPTRQRSFQPVAGGTSSRNTPAEPNDRVGQERGIVAGAIALTGRACGSIPESLHRQLQHGPIVARRPVAIIVHLAAVDVVQEIYA